MNLRNLFLVIIAVSSTAVNIHLIHKGQERIRIDTEQTISNVAIRSYYEGCLHFAIEEMERFECETEAFQWNQEILKLSKSKESQ